MEVPQNIIYHELGHFVTNYLIRQIDFTLKLGNELFSGLRFPIPTGIQFYDAKYDFKPQVQNADFKTAGIADTQMQYFKNLTGKQSDELLKLFSEYPLFDNRELAAASIAILVSGFLAEKLFSSPPFKSKGYNPFIKFHNTPSYEFDQECAIKRMKSIMKNGTECEYYKGRYETKNDIKNCRKNNLDKVMAHFYDNYFTKNDLIKTIITHLSDEVKKECNEQEGEVIIGRKKLEKYEAVIAEYLKDKDCGFSNFVKNPLGN